MTYRRIVPIVILGFCACVLGIVLIFKSSFLTILAILVPLVILGILAIIIAAAFGQGKRIYKLTGAVAAWVIFFLVWLLWSPVTFNLAAHTGAFWILQTFLVINLALLGRTGVMVTFVQTVTAIVIIGALIGLIANFVKGGPELLANAQNEFMKTTVLAHITKIETLDKERQIEPLLEKLEKLKEKAQKKPLSESEQAELEKTEKDLEKIYPPKEPKIQDDEDDKDKRYFSGIFRVPADGTIVDKDENGKELWYKKWDQIQLQQLKFPYAKLTFINRGKIPSWTSKQVLVTSAPAIKKGKVELMSPAGKEVLVQIRIIPYISRRY